MRCRGTDILWMPLYSHSRETKISIQNYAHRLITYWAGMSAGASPSTADLLWFPVISFVSPQNAGPPLHAHPRPRHPPPLLAPPRPSPPSAPPARQQDPRQCHIIPDIARPVHHHPHRLSQRPSRKQMGQ